MKTVKDIVSNEALVHFKFCASGTLWYETDCGFEFPIPKEDLEGANFLAHDKAIYFMRWIKKHLHLINEAKKEQEQSCQEKQSTS